MDYLAKYYKNLSEQLQAQVNYLEKLINESSKAELPPGYSAEYQYRHPELRSDEEAEKTKEWYGQVESPTAIYKGRGKKEYTKQSEVDALGRPTGVTIVKATPETLEREKRNQPDPQPQPRFDPGGIV